MERREVIAALGRLADNTFGRCDVCGLQISDRRLRIAPATSRCTTHLVDDLSSGPRRAAEGPTDEKGGTDAGPTRS